MGAWGTAISSNDTYGDIYADFFGLYNDGADVTELSKKIINDNKEIIDDPTDSNNFWFALAFAQWECKELDPEVLERVKSIIESGEDLKIWGALDSNREDLNKRKLVLKKFLEKLRSERAKAKPRKRKITKQPVFEKGDCVTFKLENGNFGGFVVLEAKQNQGAGLNLIGILRMNQNSKPTKDSFENAELLIVNFASWKDDSSILWYFSTGYKKCAYLFEKVGSVRITQTYDPRYYAHPFTSNFESIIERVNLQYKFEENNARPETVKIIRDLF